MALEELSLPRSWVSSTLTRERACFYPVPNFLLLPEVLTASISRLGAVKAVTSQAVMFSIAYFTLYAMAVIARAFICSLAA